MATVHLNAANFKSEVIASPLPVVVDFWAEWCGPCKMLAPMFEELSIELSGKVKLAKLNADENYQTSEEYEVRSLPTMLVFKEGKVVGRVVGYMPKSALKQQIESALK